MRSRILIALIVLAVWLHPAGAQERSETRKTVSVGTPFEIALVTNPSTGFGWTIDKKASAGLDLLAIDDVGTSPGPQRRGKPLIGAPVIHTWLITPRRTGSARLVLVYRRSFDDPQKRPSKIHTFDLTIGQ